MNYNGKTKKCFDKLIEATTTLEIIEIVENAGVTLETLKSGLTNYCIVYKQFEHENALKEKLRIYSNHIKKPQSKNDNKHEYIIACNTIKDFLKGKSSIDIYCKDNNIKINTFNKYIKLVSVMDVDLYNEFNSLIEKEKQNKTKTAKDSVNIICDLLKKGIMEDNNKRKMDVIDYYDYCHLSFDSLLKYAYKMKLSNDKKELIRKFIIANRDYDKESKYDIRQILSEKVILGDGYVVEKEFKLSVMEKLKEKKIPINRKTYTLMFRRTIKELKKDSKTKIK